MIYKFPPTFGVQEFTKAISILLRYAAADRHNTFTIRAMREEIFQ
jgi:hypothetical protein